MNLCLCRNENGCGFKTKIDWQINHMRHEVSGVER